MSRFADQLPIVTEPTPGNYLLGTDENDPKALVRIPAEGLGGGGSTEYTILDETALDVDSNVALSAGLYLYVGNAPANFDLSGLVDGERVEIINHTAHKIYLFGFDNWVWNGITTALQTNKGLIIEKGGLVGAKHSGNFLLFNTQINGLSQNWRQGLLPVDPFLANIVFSLNPETISDSALNKTISIFGNTVASTANTNLRSHSIFFDGSSDYIEINSGGDFVFSGDFTIEGWIYPISKPSYWTIFELNSYNNGLLFRPQSASNGSLYLVGSAYDFTQNINGWTHFAISRISGAVKLFINGTQIISFINNSIVNSGNSILRIGGSRHTSGQWFAGYVDLFRVTKSIGRYSSNFNPLEDTYL